MTVIVQPHNFFSPGFGVIMLSNTVSYGCYFHNPGRGSGCRNHLLLRRKIDHGDAGRDPGKNRKSGCMLNVVSGAAPLGAGVCLFAWASQARSRHIAWIAASQGEAGRRPDRGAQVTLLPVRTTRVPLLCMLRRSTETAHRRKMNPERAERSQTRRTGCGRRASLIPYAANGAITSIAKAVESTARR